MNGRIVLWRLLRCLFPYELAAPNASEIRKRAQFDEAITAKLGNPFSLPPKETATTLNGSPIYVDHNHSLHTTYEDEI